MLMYRTKGRLRNVRRKAVQSYELILKRRESIIVFLVCNKIRRPEHRGVTKKKPGQ